MQMQMNNYGRGFGGPPQPQRPGGRRGFNRGGGGNFRQTRFDNNFQRNQNQGQRPNENIPDNRPNQNQNQQQPKPLVQNQQAQAKPSQQQTAPQQQQLKPQQQQQQQQQPKPQQQQQQKLPQQQPQQQQKTPQQSPQQQQKPPQQPQQQKPQSQQQTPKPQPQPQKPQQNVPKPQNPVQDKVDSVTADPKPLMTMSFDLTGDNQQQNNQQQPKNVNGHFGGNNQGGWQGGSGNKQAGGAGNRQFGGPRQGGNQGGGMGQGQGQGPRNQGPRNQDRRGPMDGGKPVQREEHMLANKLKELVGPLLDLQPLDQSETKFNGRSRLYIGNLTNDVSEDEILKLFAPYGETAELFLNKEKNFGFIKLDYRVNAEKAKRELDGQNRHGRTLRVRFAPHNSAIRVKNLPPFVSNELLYRAFEIFGKIERAYVKVDERGKTLGEGVVEYMRKPSALAAIRNCTEKCFFLTSSLRPVIVESFEEPDEFDGYPEKNLPKKHPEFLRSRELGPRFSELSSFEHEYGTRWKQLHELHRQKEEALKKELAAEQEKLEAQMEYAKYEHETELLRAQLRQREQDRERQKRNWEMAERSAEERRDSERANLLRQEEELALRMRAQDDELRRRQQENTLFVQAQRLNSMLDRQEQGMFDSSQPMDGGFREQFDMGRGYDDMPASRGWEGPRQIDDFPNKRRRY